MLSAILALLISSMVFAEAVHVVTTSEGARTEAFSGLAGPIRHTSLDDPLILWSRNLATGIPNSVSIADTLFAFSGSGLNDPREAARYEIDALGEPAYAALGTEWEVAASQNGLYWAAVDRDATNNNVLYFYSTEVDTPLWSTQLGAGYVGGTRGLQFSRDGSTLGLFFGRIENQIGIPPQVLAWLVAEHDSVPYVNYIVGDAQGISARAMAISSDGAIIAATADNFLHVVDRESGLARDVVEIGASTDGLALSADGNWALTGFQAVRCFFWNGTQYIQRWQSSLNSHYNSQLLISPDTTYAVSCWYPLQYNRSYVRVHNLSNGQILWSYRYNLGTGGYQEWPIDVDISEDSRWFAVGSWGDEGSNNGEVVVFSRYHAHPYYELDLPGSCFSLDLSGNGKYLMASGKHVHANQFGNGGDIVVVDLDPPPFEPIPQIPDSELIIESFVTFCIDTLHLRIPVYNAGYASMTIDSMVLQSGFGTADESIVDFDTVAIRAEIPPGDTLWIPVTFLPCAHDISIGWYTHIFRIDVAGLSLGYGVIAQFVYPNAAENTPILLPQEYTLSTFPNPFNPTTNLSFTLPQAGTVDLAIYNTNGRLATQVNSEYYLAGTHSIVFDASDLPSGIYIAHLNANGVGAAQKLVLMK